MLNESSALEDPKLKTLYRQLTIRFHPDNKKTGDESLMKEMNGAASEGDRAFIRFLNKLEHLGIVRKEGTEGTKEKTEKPNWGGQEPREKRDYSKYESEAYKEQVKNAYKKAEEAFEKAKEAFDKKGKSDFETRYEKAKEAAAEESKKREQDPQRESMNKLLKLSTQNVLCKSLAKKLSDGNFTMTANITIDGLKPVLKVLCTYKKFLKKIEKIYSYRDEDDKLADMSFQGFAEILARVKAMFLSEEVMKK